MIVRYFTLALVACVAAVTGRLTGRIIGGGEARENAYPYQASLRVHGSHKCGGSVINHEWILTAAHCLVKYDSKLITVVLGTNSLLSGGVAYHAKYTVVHPNHNRTSRMNDIGLIRIDGYINYTNSIAPIALPSKNTKRTDLGAIFTGWGDVEAIGITYDKLQEIELDLIALDECRKTFPRVRDTNICTLTAVGQGLCYGDSGSPLVRNGVQIAIGSWGSPCALGYPDVHTRVYSYVDWIAKVLNFG